MLWPTNDVKKRLPVIPAIMNHFYHIMQFYFVQSETGIKKETSKSISYVKSAFPSSITLDFHNF